MNMKRNMFHFLSKWYANRNSILFLCWNEMNRHLPYKILMIKTFDFRVLNFRFLNFRISVSNLDRCSTNAEAQSAHQVWMHQSYCSLLGVFFQRACMEADSKWVFVCRKVLLQHFIGFLNVSGRSHHFFNPARTRRYSQYMD